MHLQLTSLREQTKERTSSSAEGASAAQAEPSPAQRTSVKLGSSGMGVQGAVHTRTSS